jgi:hypothetical protein
MTGTTFFVCVLTFVEVQFGGIQIRGPNLGKKMKLNNNFYNKKLGTWGQTPKKNRAIIFLFFFSYNGFLSYLPQITGDWLDDLEIYMANLDEVTQFICVLKSFVQN